MTDIPVLKMTPELKDLYFRRNLANSCIQMLLTDQKMMTDPRQPEVVKEYKLQLSAIDVKITAAEKLERQRLGIPEPEPIIVNLKTAIMFPRTKS